LTKLCFFSSSLGLICSFFTRLLHVNKREALVRFTYKFTSFAVPLFNFQGALLVVSF